MLLLNLKFFLNKHALIILMLFIFFNQMIWINVVPYNFAPDEFSHFDIVERSVSSGRYPIFYQNPPMGILNKEGQTTASFSALQPLPYLFDSIIVHSVKNLIQLKHWFLFARIGSAAFICLYACFVYFTLRLLIKERYNSLVASAIAGFIPALTFIGSYVNSDAMALGISSLLIFYSTFVFFTNKPAGSRFFIAGSIIGLTMLTRFNTFPVLVTSILILTICLLKSSGKNVKTLLILGGAFITSGWWFIRNWVLYGDPFMVGKYYEVLKIVRAEEFRNYGVKELLFNTDWLLITLKSFFASFDWNYIFLPGWIYGLALTITIISFIKFLSLLNTTENNVRILFIVFLTGAIVSFLTTLLQSAFQSYQPQGRYLFPVYPILIAILTYGLASFTKKRVISLFIFLMVILINLYSLFAVIIPRYYTVSSFYKVAFFEIIFMKPFPFNFYGQIFLFLGFFCFGLLFFMFLSTSHIQKIK